MYLFSSKQTKQNFRVDIRFCCKKKVDLNELNTQMFLFSDSPQNKSQIFNANFLISAYIRSGQMNNHQIALNNDANSSPSSMEQQTFSMDGGNRTDNTTFEWEQNEFHTSFVDDFFIDPNIVSLIYLSYMPICCGIGLTGNAMVWILIR